MCPTTTYELADKGLRFEYVALCIAEYWGHSRLSKLSLPWTESKTSRRSSGRPITLVDIAYSYWRNCAADVRRGRLRNLLRFNVDFKIFISTERTLFNSTEKNLRQPSSLNSRREVIAVLISVWVQYAPYIYSNIYIYGVYCMHAWKAFVCHIACLFHWPNGF